MPIKDKSLYPKNWKEIVTKVLKRSGGRCECLGQCGLHTTMGRCIELGGEEARYARGRIVLTVAHLCHDASCDDIAHLRHMCQRCHNRYDVPFRRKNSRKTRQDKKAMSDLFQ